MPNTPPNNPMHRGWFRKGQRLSEETKRKMALSRTGLVPTPEARAKMSEAWTPERRAKMSALFKEMNKDGRLKHKHPQRLSAWHIDQIVKGSSKFYASLPPKQKLQLTLARVLAAAKTNAKNNASEQLVEACLMELGVPFLTQHAFVAKKIYIVDFYFPKFKTALECDGQSHSRRKDQQRDRVLKQEFGIRTIRIKRRHLASNPKEVVLALKAAGVI